MSEIPHLFFIYPTLLLCLFQLLQQTLRLFTIPLPQLQDLISQFSQHIMSGVTTTTELFNSRLRISSCNLLLGFEDVIELQELLIETIKPLFGIPLHFVPTCHLPQQPTHLMIHHLDLTNSLLLLLLMLSEFLQQIALSCRP